LGRLLRGLARGTLDDIRVVHALRASLLAAAFAGLALAAIDPVSRGQGAMAAVQLTASQRVLPEDRASRITATDVAPAENRIRAALVLWSERALIHRARAFLWVDLLAFAPLLALAILAFCRHFEWLLQHDRDTPPQPYHAVAERLPAWIALGSVFAAIAADGLTLYALTFAGSPSTLPAWLPLGVELSAWARVACLSLGLLLALVLLARWYFPPSDAAQPAADRARLRAAVADMMWRSKYAVFVLVAHGALVLGMDQTRDALVRQVLDHDGALSAVLGAVITLLAVLLLGFASWLWPRVILRLRGPGDPEEPHADRRIEAFARWWSRLLGLAPFGIVALVLAQAMHDVPADSEAVPWFAAAMALVGVLALVYLFVVVTRRRGDMDYYRGALGMSEARMDMRWWPAVIIWGSPALFLLARYAGLHEGTPPLALAVITTGLGTWAGILGWVAYESRRAAVPYFLALLLLVGALGVLDWSDVHRMRTWTDGIGAEGAGDLHRTFRITLVLAAITAAMAWVWLKVTDSARARALTGVATLAVVALVTWTYDRAPGSESPVGGRPGIETAMGTWLRRIHAEVAQLPAGRTEAGYPVFIVSSEGGGIRSAYWTATVLVRMKRLVEGFDDRTFSLAGVSGGALGVAMYRACTTQPERLIGDMERCVDRVGGADLWTQLMGGLMFEDAIAAMLPTALYCRSPGCSVLGRSHWFEGALEAAAPQMAQGLVRARGERPWLPHVFLTATRVETGERVIQSDVAVDTSAFPGAVDLLHTAAADIRLGTAAHNSARFPVTNPVGAVYGPECRTKPVELTDRMMRGASRLCARVQDGGYFDNSSGLTSSDILRVLRDCLVDAGCGLTSAEAARLRSVLRPVVISVRNERRATLAAGETAPTFCTPPTEPEGDRGVPVRAAPLNLFPEALSGVATLYYSREAHMRHADALLQRDAKDLWKALSIAAGTPPQRPCGPVRTWIGTQPIHRFDLADDGRLYPQGWMLSRHAMEGMRAQAARALH
jgi:hypothetical protein